jgi:hypothetical protein
MKQHYIFYLVIILSGFITGFSHFKSAGKNIRPVIIYLGVILFSELFSFFMAKYYRNNMPVYHIVTPLHFLLLGIFFYRNIIDTRIKIFSRWIIGGFIFFSLINTIFIQNILTFPGNFTNSITLIYIFFSASLFLQQLELPSSENIFKNPVFIIATAILWFNIVSFLFFLLYDFAKTYKLDMSYMNNIHYFSNIVYYLLLLSAMIFSKLNFKHAGKI